MSAAPVLPPVLPKVAVHARRCVRHSTREAAARCPGCGEFFCRECVVEHDGKLLCAPCLAKVSRGTQSRRRRFLQFGRVAQTIAGLLLLWFLIYGLGALLLKAPPDFHDGTIWRHAEEEPR